MAAKQNSNKPRSRRPRPFTGILAQPITPPPVPRAQDADDPALQRWLARSAGYLVEARMQRVHALLERYGIHEDGRPTDAVLFDLVMSLVEEFNIPGFRIAGDKPKGGRPKTWNFAAGARLLYAVAEAMARNRKLSARGACMRLVVPGRLYSKYKSDSLYRTYQKIRKERPGLVKMVELATQGRSDEIQVVGFRPTIKVSD